MKIYAVIDTNVIISALLSRHQDSATVKVLDHLYNRTIIPIYNDEILDEYTAVLRRPKFNFSERTINATIEAIRKGGVRSDRRPVCFRSPRQGTERSDLQTTGTQPKDWVPVMS